MSSGAPYHHFDRPTKAAMRAARGHRSLLLVLSSRGLKLSMNRSSITEIIALAHYYTSGMSIDALRDPFTAWSVYVR